MEENDALSEYKYEYLLADEIDWRSSACAPCSIIYWFISYFLLSKAVRAFLGYVGYAVFFFVKFKLRFYFAEILWQMRCAFSALIYCLLHYLLLLMALPYFKQGYGYLFIALIKLFKTFITILLENFILLTLSENIHL